MGVHTGDSITVAPAMTLSRSGVSRDARRGHRLPAADRRRNRRVQCAIRRRPATGRRIIIEMNPRVSRSSALASKATGFPIAKIAAKLAVGYTPRRDRQRHHRSHPGVVRAGTRLRGGQGSPIRLREVPLGRQAAGNVDAERWGSHGDRAFLSRGAAEGAAQSRDGPAGPQRRCGRAGVRGDARRRRALQGGAAFAGPDLPRRRRAAARPFGR